MQILGIKHEIICVEQLYISNGKFDISIKSKGKYIYEDIRIKDVKVFVNSKEYINRDEKYNGDL